MITTPKGISIPIPIDQAFCMMERLSPTVKPYQVLATAAGFYNMSGFTTLLAGLVCFWLRLDILPIALVTFTAAIFGYFMAVYALYPPGYLFLARNYASLKGFGLFLIGPSIVGIFTVGPLATSVFWGAKILAEFVTMSHAKRIGMKFLHVTQPDAYELMKRASVNLAPDGLALRSFGNAHASFASKMNVPLGFATESEIESYGWRFLLEEFIKEWPEIARRFQVTKEEWEELLPPN